MPNARFTPKPKLAAYVPAYKLNNCSAFSTVATRRNAETTRAERCVGCTAVH